MASSHYNGYLSGQDITWIQKKISQVFAEEGEKVVLKNINQLKKEVDTILKKVTLAGSKAETKYIKRNTQEKETLMAEAYILIFKLREFLMDEKINYRYYYNTDDGVAKVVQFGEDSILDYMRFDENRLAVSRTKLTKALEEQSYQKLLDRHYNNLIAGIQPARDEKNNLTSYKVVHSYIMNKYGDMNPGLRKKDDVRLYQLFNMGHVFEAMDIAFTEAINNDLGDNFDVVESLMYGKYLAYDNIEGTKGGDNAITMTQIKSNSAGFLKYHTVREALEDISEMLNETLSQEEIRAKIEKLYVSKVKYDDIETCEQMIDRAVQKLIDAAKA